METTAQPDTGKNPRGTYLTIQSCKPNQAASFVIITFSQACVGTVIIITEQLQSCQMCYDQWSVLFELVKSVFLSERQRSRLWPSYDGYPCLFDALRVNV